jgi:stage III sporulation protein AC
LPFCFGKTVVRRNGDEKMDISLIIKIAGIGILVAVASQILAKTGRDEQATFVTIAGIIVALMLLISQIRELFDMVSAAFGM